MASSSFCQPTQLTIWCCEVDRRRIRPNIHSFGSNMTQISGTRLEDIKGVLGASG